jgi:hypothetical protein
MLLGIVGDYTAQSTLDGELLATPDSGLYFNSGVHPSINVTNLLHFLPNIEITFIEYAAGTTYGKYSDSRLQSDIVTNGGITYQSLTSGNIGNTPASNPSNWLVTNLDSLRLKFFIQSVEDKVLADINLVRRQVDSQYLYNLVEQDEGIVPVSLPNDFAAITLEAKGSDYTAFTLNEVAFQATTADQQNLYVINQGVLIETIILNPNLEGRLVFESIKKSYSGKGRWIFAVDSQDVLTRNAYLDPLKYDGFVASAETGIGSTPESADYAFSQNSNGLAFNITVHTDPSLYVEHNLVNFGQFYQATFELEAFRMFQTNANDRSNREQRIQMNDTLLNVEIRDLTNDTAARRYNIARDKAIKQLEKTFDREIAQDDNILTIEVNSV